MLKIRLQRIGRRNNPSYRVVVVNATAAARKGKPVELLGTHDTIRKTTSLNNERILYWISQGAQVSDTMHNILIKNGVIEGVKINVLPKKSPITKEKEDATASDTKDETQVADTGPAQEGTTTDTAETKKTKESPSDNSKAAAEAEVPEEKNNTNNNIEIDKKEPQSPPPQDTPSAEG